PTSIWSCITREFGQPPEERRQMTAVATLTGALSRRMTVRGLQARMVKVGPQPGVCRGTTAFRKERAHGLSGMQGNCAPCHARSHRPPEEAGVEGIWLRGDRLT